MQKPCLSISCRAKKTGCLSVGLVLTWALAAACGGKSDNAAANGVAAAGTAPGSGGAAPAANLALEAKLAQAKAEREAAEAEKAKLKAEKEAKIDAVTVLPAKMPKNKEKACEAMVKGYDTYMSSVLTGDMKTKWDSGGNEMQLKVFRVECNKRNLEVGACQAHALTQMTPELKSDLSTIMHRCVEKFAAKAPA